MDETFWNQVVKWIEYKILYLVGCKMNWIGMSEWVLGEKVMYLAASANHEKEASALFQKGDDDKVVADRGGEEEDINELNDTIFEI